MSKDKNLKKKRRHNRIRKVLKGTKDRPRLVVHRSLQAINAQVIDDDQGKTLVSVSSVSMKQGKDTPVVFAEKIGEILGKKCKEKKITTICFDRNGYKYHGKVKALADGARKSGLIF